MSDPVQFLKELQPAKEYFIGIDSDGCVFDSMEIKHKECFIPMFIKHFNLQAVSKYARETWEFVNLYSKTRGTNRFPALCRSVALLSERPQVRARNVSNPDVSAVEEWMARESKLGNATLAAEVENGNQGLAPIKKWSDAVNDAIKDIVYGVPPFPLFRESLEKLSGSADAMVISQTPTDALEREWKENEIHSYVRFIAGQEAGTKTEHLAYAAKDKYAPGKILMIGDAPGDFKAAKANGALFYPIKPGDEENSWKRFFDEALDRFFSANYAGDFEEMLINEFEACLPENPTWS
ncbi:MAG TPA: HAD family hydrolase [Verrucomicrobiales bacterium]|jgi:phosphoglycolate phosphatase-like HAD superfamily hydrolase|nr:HAD family hydrolase [Verrucomicrobiales bacterium]